MKNRIIILFCLLVSCSVVAKDRLEVFKDYDLGSDILNITTVKVDPNMSDVYLAGLKDSWIKAMIIQKDLGYIKDWKIYASELSISGDFNMILVIIFDSVTDLEPNKERYAAFMKKWGEANEKKANKISAKYPEVRTLTGEYRMREIIIK